MLLSLVPRAGLEPASPFERLLLKQVRLPISPPRHQVKLYLIIVFLSILAHIYLLQTPDTKRLTIFLDRGLVAEFVDCGWADAFDIIEFVDRLKRPIGISIVDDRLGSYGADAG